MDFELSDDHRAVGDLAAKILGDRATVERVRDAEEQQDGLDTELWRLLAESGLLAIAVPEEQGGAGMGMLGLTAVLEQQGRRVAPVPLWPTLAGAALPLARFGASPPAREALAGLLDGSRLVTSALDVPEAGDARPEAIADGSGWRLDGELPAVPAADAAAAVLIPVARPGHDPALALVPTDRDGVTTVPVQATSRERMAAVRLGGVAVDAAELLAGDADDPDPVAWARRRAWVALAALSAGVCAEAVSMTASYASQREQFGRPLSTNQGVAMRIADAHIDAENVLLTARQAAWLLDGGDEDGGETAALVAAWWASHGGLSVVRATQHLHGGIGADVDYPIHRYFLWGRQIAFILGSAGALEARLGDRLEDGAAIGAPA